MTATNYVRRSTIRHPAWDLHGLDGCLDCGNDAPKPTARGLCRTCQTRRRERHTLGERPVLWAAEHGALPSTDCPVLLLAATGGATQAAEWLGTTREALHLWHERQKAERQRDKGKAHHAHALRAEPPTPEQVAEALRQIRRVSSEDRDPMMLEVEPASHDCWGVRASLTYPEGAI